MLEALAYFDPLWKLLELIAVVGGFIIAIRKMSKTSRDQELAGAKHAIEVQATLLRQNEIITELKEDSKEAMTAITNLLTKIAVYDSRMERIETDVQELRHWRGFIVDPPAAILPPPRSRGSG